VLEGFHSGLPVDEDVAIPAIEAYTLHDGGLRLPALKVGASALDPILIFARFVVHGGDLVDPVGSRLSLDLVQLTEVGIELGDDTVNTSGPADEVW
jgi:hypothetical protein